MNLELFMDVDKLVEIRHWWEKRKVWQDICNSVALLVYLSHIFFTSKQIDLSKENKGRQKLYDVNVRAIYGCRQVGAGHEHIKKTLFLLQYARAYAFK